LQPSHGARATGALLKGEELAALETALLAECGESPQSLSAKKAAAARLASDSEQRSAQVGEHLAEVDDRLRRLSAEYEALSVRLSEVSAQMNSLRTSRETYLMSSTSMSTADKIESVHRSAREAVSLEQDVEELLRALGALDRILAADGPLVTVAPKPAKSAAECALLAMELYLSAESRCIAFLASRAAVARNRTQSLAAELLLTSDKSSLQRVILVAQQDYEEDVEAIESMQGAVAERLERFTSNVAASSGTSVLAVHLNGHSHVQMQWGAPESD
jgi:chromosome segregation ATPase